MATLEYPPGEEILRPFSVRPDTLVLTPGPSNSYPRVLDVSSHQVTTENSDGIFRTMDELIVGFQYVFQTSNTYTYAVGGTGEFSDLHTQNKLQIYFIVCGWNLIMGGVVLVCFCLLIRDGRNGGSICEHC